MKRGWTKGKPASVAAYLAAAPLPQRRVLRRLRASILAAAPGAEECIAYQLPSFRLDGRLVVAFGAAAKHCALYPMSRRVVAAHREALARFDVSPGTIRFTPERPLPASLVRAIVKARVAENAGKARPRTRRAG